MKKHIIGQSHRKPNTLINKRSPAILRAKIDDLLPGLDPSHNRQPRQRSPLKRHRATRSREIANDDEPNLIFAFVQIRRDVQRVVIPYQGTAPAGPDGDVFPIDIEFVPRVGGEV